MAATNFTLYHNAYIHTLEEEPVYNWLLSSSGSIVAIGRQNDYPDLSPNKMKMIDLQGGHVYPAFTDAHTHLFMSALNARHIDLRPANSLDEALQILRHHSRLFAPGEWIEGYGFDKNLWTDGQPHKKYLDQIFPDNPVVLESKDCHSIWVNSPALKAAGLKKDSSNPSGGKLARDGDGALNGLLYEQALPLVQKQVPAADVGPMKQAVKNLFKEFHKRGITSAHTMEGLKEYGILQDLMNEGQLKLRVSIYIPYQESAWLTDNQLRSGFGDDWLRLGGVKIFADGSLGSRTAEMLAPYENEPQNRGLAHLSEAEISEIVAHAARNGLSPAVHAIGDAAVLKVLRAFQKSLAWRQKWGFNFRMEHAQLVPEEALPLFRETHTIASMQPIHIADDVRNAERYWGARSARAYPIKDMLASGIPLAFGSDTPVADFDPLKGIFSAAHRRYHLQLDEAPWRPEQAISIEQALRAYTIGGAAASGERHLKGSLKAGKVADFIVLDKALSELSESEPLNASVRQTILSGEIVYQRS